MKNLKEIPDRNFRNKLKIYFPAAFEDELLDINNEKIVSCGFLNLNGLNIKDLTGIEWFINLKYLYCSYNKLTSLPVLPIRLEILVSQDNNMLPPSTLPKSLSYFGWSISFINKNNQIEGECLEYFITIPY